MHGWSGAFVTPRMCGTAGAACGGLSAQSALEPATGAAAARSMYWRGWKDPAARFSTGNKHK
eukprot:5107504-Prymnesium_polylepis.1